jgi:diketogulonate reductase-like aldo/keto reductase
MEQLRSAVTRRFHNRDEDDPRILTEDIVPIPGTKRRKYLQENIGALDVDLSSGDLARIEEVAPKDAFAGSRYPKAMMDLLNR